MFKRILSMLLAVAVMASMLVIPSSAAPTLDEAMKEVNIYAKDKDLDWLTMYHKVKKQNYTYYNYVSPQTHVSKQIPAYCVDPRLYGVPAKVPEGDYIRYSAQETVSDP